jgi:hypothetical protein
MPSLLTLEKLQDKLKYIKSLGFVRSHRKGATGIGKTLEDLLEITENNIKLPDWGEIELKTQRADDNSMLTLFTFNHKAWVIDQLSAIERFGSPDAQGRLGLYYTLSGKPNSAGLFIYTNESSVQVRHIDGAVVVSWNLDKLVEQFENKVKSILLVGAQTDMRDGIEYFYYDRARLLTGGTDIGILKSQFERGDILIDLRLHKKEVEGKKTVSRNHGTGFRVKRNKIEQVYENVQDILLV